MSTLLRAREQMVSEFFQNPRRKQQEATRPVVVARFEEDGATSAGDVVACEEPLEIRIGFRLRGKPAQKSISVTMRTPGHDRELAAGFLLSESIISAREDIERFEWVFDEEQDENSAENTAEQESNILRVHLAEHVEVDTASLVRHFYTTSSCGVCGKASIEALQVKNCPVLLPDDFRLPAGLVSKLPARLRAAQSIFEETGGIHAAGLFDESGELVDHREDVGRHNAMDKLVGAQLLADGTQTSGAHTSNLSLERTAVVLSGRASFELLQKATVAQIPIVIAVGAPSSLAVELADEFGVTLVGFARAGRFNVYTHPERIDL